MSRIVKILAFLLLLCTIPGFSARAAEINFVPSDPVVAVGDTFTVNIEISLSEGVGEQLAGGIIDLGYEDGVVEIIAVAIDSYWDFLPDPGSKTGPDQWEGIGFDAFVNDPATGDPATGIAVIATITLEALAAGISQLVVLNSSQFFSATAEFFPALTDASIRVNTLPVADDLTAAAEEDTAVDFTLTGSDDDGDDLIYAVVTGPAHGTLSGTAPDLTYTPAVNFYGNDSFTFQVNDGAADSDTATVTITVAAVNDPPTAGDLSVTTGEDVDVTFSLTGSDVDGDDLIFSLVTGPANGTLSGTAPNLAYTPDANFSGSDGFTFQVSDGSVLSNPGTVTITVNPVNDAPVADDQDATTDEDAAVEVTLTGSDIDGDDLTFSVVSDPAHGTLSGTTPNLTYTPAADFNGSDSFTYQADDGALDSNIATVSITVNPIEDAPVADDQAVTTDEDIAVAITLTGGDADGDPVTFSVVTDPANGTLSGTPPNLTYTPAADYSGSDSFTYEASAGGLDSNIATVTITISAVNDVPVADAGFDEIVVVGSTVSLDGSASSDGEGDALTFSWTFVSMPAESVAVLSDPAAVNPNFVADRVGEYVYELVVNDGSDDSAVATVTITADLDTDIDGIPQSLDNCTAVANADQRDTDGDGYGNLCDGDLNNDGEANTLDLNLYRLAHRTELGAPAYNPDADFNGDDSIDTLDLNIYRGLHRQPLGPSCCAE